MRLLGLYLFLIGGAAFASPRDPSVSGPTDGLLVGPTTAPTPFPPWWVTGSGEVVSPSAVEWAPGQIAQGPLVCYDISGDQAIAVENGTPLYEGEFRQGFSNTGFVKLAGDATRLYAVGRPPRINSPNGKLIVDETQFVRVVRISCHGRPEFIGDLPIPEAQIPAVMAGEQLVYPMFSDGSFLSVTRAGIVRIQPSPPTMTPVLVSADLLNIAIPSDAMSFDAEGAVLTVTGLAISPDETVWFSVERNLPIGSKAYLAKLVAGRVEVVQEWALGRGQSRGLFWSATEQAIVSNPVMVNIGAVRQELLLPILTEDSRPTDNPPWPYAHDLLTAYSGQFVGLVGGADGRLRVSHETPAGYTLGELGFDLERSDFDHDGLSRSEERRLGTKDTVRDSDGDGAEDAVEVGLGTNPTDANEPPPVPESSEVLAPSSAPMDWRGDWDTLHRQPFAGHLVCEAVCVTPGCQNRKWQCFDAENRMVGEPWDAPPNFSLDGEVGFFGEEVQDPGWPHRRRLMRRNVEGGESTVVLDDPNRTFETGLFFPLTPRLIFHATGGVLTRFVDAVPHIVIDSDRVDCPVTANAEELGRCQDLDQYRDDDFSWRLLGIHRERAAVLVLIVSGPKSQVFEVNEDGARFVVDTRTFPGSQEPTRLLETTDPAGRHDGWLALFETTRGEGGGARYASGSAVLDRFFRPKNVDQPPVTASAAGLGSWFKGGFFETKTYSLWHVPATGGTPVPCLLGRYNFCDQGRPRNDPFQAPVPIGFSWVPTATGLSAGDILLFSEVYNNQQTTTPRWIGQDGIERSGFDGMGTENWHLNRIGTSGGMLRWMDGPRFRALADSNGAASLLTNGLRKVTQLGVRDDARKVCLVEGELGRVWEVSVGERGEPEAVVLIDERTELKGCSYSAAGKLGLLGSRLEVEGQNGPASEATKLIRVGEFFVLGGPGVSATCVSSSGQSSSTHRIMIAMSRVGNDGLAFIDERGQVYAGPVSEICNGELPRENLLDVSIWELLVAMCWSGWSERPIPTGGSLSIGPSGLVYVSTEGLRLSTAYFDDLVFRFRATWAPTDWARRMVEMDPIRREQAWIRFESPTSTRVSAMVSVPGSPIEDASWEYLGRTAPPPVTEPVVMPEPEPEKPVVPVESTPEVSESCSCRTHSSEKRSYVWAIALALLFRGARRTSRRARAPESFVLGSWNGSS